MLGAMQASADKGANIIVLPEMWNCPYSNDSFETYAEDINSGSSQSFNAMQEMAKELQVILIAGSIPEREGDKLYNTSCIFDTDGSLLGTHRYAPR
jgi:omega-amidase